MLSPRRTKKRSQITSTRTVFVGKRSRVSELIHCDPRGATESAWIDRLEFLLRSLADATSSYLQVGTYWCDDFPGHQTASITTRVRSRDKLPGVESDYWDAAVCYTGGHDRSYADAYIFPFDSGIRMGGSGPLPPGSPERDLEEFRWYQFEQVNFVDRGWAFPDGPGEWSWVESPGVEYWERLQAKPTSLVFAEGKPITIEVSGLTRSRWQDSGATGRLSLIHVNRGRERSNLHPRGEHIPRNESSDTVRLTDLNRHGSTVLLDLAKFNIRGGWTPGRYHVAIRAQNCRDPNEWRFSADISQPIKFQIQ